LQSDGQLIDNFVSGSAELDAPTVADLFRPVLHATLSARINEQQNRFLTVGGDSGLRGYAIADFAGQVAFLGNAELRSRPFKLWIYKIGGLLFYDVGHAANSLGELQPHHDIGIGIRALIPELQPLALRFDYAFPLTDSPFFPGRWSAGFGQVF
jgi:hemolysin activation/secretion protein